MDACRAFVERLANVPALPATVNPYAGDGPAAVRRDNLARYLSLMLARRPALLLVGEAPGYRGARVTGVPFTSEAVLLGEPAPFGLFGASAGFCGCGEPGIQRREATATVLWNTLATLDYLPLLWNACPLHPHQPGRPDSNRAPNAAELAPGQTFVADLLALYAIERVVAVGRKAQWALAAWGIPAAHIRHPGHGGKDAFAAGHAEVKKEYELRRHDQW